jgi:hypothetical protein
MNRRELFRSCYVDAKLRKWPGSAPNESALILLGGVLAATLDGDVEASRCLARGLVSNRRQLYGSVLTSQAVA